MSVVYDLTAITSDILNNKKGFFVSAENSAAVIHYRIPSGVTPLDVILNGGFPGGKITEIYGESSTGKSLLALSIARGCQQMGGLVLYIDVEGTTDPNFMHTIGVNPDQIIVSNESTVEGIYDAMIEFCDQKKVIETKLHKSGQLPTDQVLPALIIWDSLTQATTKDAQKVTDKEGIAGTYRMSGLATAMNRIMREGQLPAVLTASQVTLLILNQLRDNVGASMFEPSKVTTGGHALGYAASVRLELSASKKHKNAQDEVIGVTARARLIKSKSDKQFSHVTFPIFFSSGVNNALATYDWLDGKGFINKAGSWKTIDWLTDEPIKWQSAVDWFDIWNTYYTEIQNFVWSVVIDRKDVNPENPNEVL